MTIKEIQDGVINDLKELYVEEQFFTHDIYKCNNLFDLIDALSHYGYDRQGALSVLNSVIITTEWVSSLSDEEVNEMIMDEWDRKLDGV